MPPRARVKDDVSFTDVIVEDVPIEDIPEPFTETEPELPPPGRRRSGKLTKELEQMYTAIGTAVYPFNPRVGATVVGQANSCAESLDELARNNPRVRKALEKMLTTGAWSGVIAAHLPILVAVATEYVPFVRESYEQSFAQQPDNVTPMAR